MKNVFSLLVFLLVFVGCSDKDKQDDSLQGYIIMTSEEYESLLNDKVIIGDFEVPKYKRYGEYPLHLNDFKYQCATVLEYNTHILHEVECGIIKELSPDTCTNYFYSNPVESFTRLDLFTLDGNFPFLFTNYLVSGEVTELYYRVYGDHKSVYGVYYVHAEDRILISDFYN